MPFEKNSLYFAITQIFFEKEKEKFDALLIRKAKYLKVLQAKDLFSLTEVEAMQLQKRINYLTEELKIMHGFQLFTDDMKSCYEDSVDKIYNAYHNRNYQLELGLYQLEQQYKFLYQDYLETLSSLMFFEDLAIQKLEEITELKKQMKNER